MQSLAVRTLRPWRMWMVFDIPVVLWIQRYYLQHRWWMQRFVVQDCRAAPPLRQ